MADDKGEGLKDDKGKEPQPLSAADLPQALRDRLTGVDVAALADIEIEDPFTETEEEARERKARQGALKRARWDDRLPVAFATAALGDFDADVAAKLRRALEDPVVLTVVLAGPVGTGKTHAAYAMGGLAVAAGRWVEAWTVHDLMAEMMPDANSALMEYRARCAHVLLLDDLGAGRVTDYTIETIESIVDARVAHHRKTIISTNLSEPVLRAVWGDRLLDRMRQQAVVHEFTGPSRRAPAW